MAITQNPIIGRTRKSAGGMVFSTVHGKNIMRAKPASYRTPDTESHRKRVGKFKAGNELASKVKNYARGFFETQPVGRSAYSAMSSQIQAAFNIGHAGTEYSPLDVLMGSGSLPIVRCTNQDVPSTSTIKVDWDPTINDPDESDTDTVSVMVTKADGTNGVLLTSTTARSLGTKTFTLPEGFRGIQIFISTPIFTSANGMKKSAFYLSDTDTPVIYE